MKNSLATMARDSLRGILHTAGKLWKHHAFLLPVEQMYCTKSFCLDLNGLIPQCVETAVSISVIETLRKHKTC